MYIGPDSDKIPAELIQAGSGTLQSEIHMLSNSVWNKEESPDQWKGVYYCTNSKEGR
jgi:hypothetical protein